MDRNDKTRWLRRVAAGVIIGVTALAVSSVLTPRDPALLAGLPSDVDASNVELVRRVAQQFPAGTPEVAARKTLLDQGFTVSTGEAKWDRSEFPCKTFVTIRWAALDGRIVSTSATRFQACT